MSAVRLEFELSLLVMAQPIKALYFNPHIFWFLPLISTTLCLSTLPAERICNQANHKNQPQTKIFLPFFHFWGITIVHILYLGTGKTL